MSGDSSRHWKEEGPALNFYSSPRALGVKEEAGRGPPPSKGWSSGGTGREPGKDTSCTVSPLAKSVLVLPRMRQKESFYYKSKDKAQVWSLESDLCTLEG